MKVLSLRFKDDYLNKDFERQQKQLKSSFYNFPINELLQDSKNEIISQVYKMKKHVFDFLKFTKSNEKNTPISHTKCQKYSLTNENYHSPFWWKSWKLWFVGFWQNFLRKSLLNSLKKSILQISNILGIHQNQQQFWFVGKYGGQKFH